jgi:MoaA/NifB/PqqE/SkfB family radical SAM enzyme
MNSGGEPTLAKRLYDYLVVEHEVLPDARLQISSNGILAEKLVDVAENCLADGIKLDVGLSIDGVGKSHDYWRGINGNFERLDWLLHRLVKLRNIYPDLSIGLGSTLTAETVKRADEMVRYCNKFGATFMWHWYNRNSFYGNSKIDLMPDMSAGKTLQKVMGKGLYVKMWMDYLRTGVVPKFKCFSLKSFLCIKCNGDVVPCLNKWDQSAGNVRKENPLQIWTGRQAESLRNEIQECTGCLNSWCVGWSLQSQPHVILLDRVKGRLRG